MDQKEFRKKILHLHYNLSEGNSWNLVMRPIVAEKLRMKDFNDRKLLGAIKYLEDKGFLKAVTNVQDQITDLGIDEVENDYPNFPKNKNDEMVSQLNNLLIRINQDIELSKKELLKSDRLKETESKVRNEIKALKDFFDEEDRLQVEKLLSGWTTELKSGFTNKGTTEDKLMPWHDLISIIIENLTGNKPCTEAHISVGQLYEGRKILRMILKSATKEIVIIDNFLHPEILMVVEPYLNQVGTIKFLTRKNGNSNFNSFVSDLVKFRQQYSTFPIEAKQHDECHDRYIIVDGTTVYHSGPSFHDLGKRSGGINQMVDETEENKFFNDFDNWWSKGETI